jgi:hypothetical protein
MVTTATAAGEVSQTVVLRIKDLMKPGAREMPTLT